jgi:hypothetical protein
MVLQGFFRLWPAGRGQACATIVVFFSAHPGPVSVCSKGMAPDTHNQLGENDV